MQEPHDYAHAQLCKASFKSFQTIECHHRFACCSIEIFKVIATTAAQRSWTHQWLGTCCPHIALSACIVSCCNLALHNIPSSCLQTRCVVTTNMFRHNKEPALRAPNNRCHTVRQKARAAIERHLGHTEAYTLSHRWQPSRSNACGCWQLLLTQPLTHDSICCMCQLWLQSAPQPSFAVEHITDCNDVWVVWAKCCLLDDQCTLQQRPTNCIMPLQDKPEQFDSCLPKCHTVRQPSGYMRPQTLCHASTRT